MKYFLLVLTIACLHFSCKKNNSPDNPDFQKEYTISNQPEALAIHDNSNFGIYKGVVINAQDSTVTMKFNFYNGHTEPYALVHRNFTVSDSLIRFKTTETGTIIFPAVQDVSQLPENTEFFWTIFSNYRVGLGPVTGFNAHANGINPVMDVQLYNNATLNAVMKEKSNKQVTCYEGAYSGLDSGRIALVMTADSVRAIRASIWNPQFFIVMGAKVQNGSFTLEQLDEISGRSFIFQGTVQNNGCSGTWTRSEAPGVTNQFTAIRTL